MYVFEGGINAKKSSSVGAFSPSAWGSPKVGMELGIAGSGICGDTGVTRNTAMVSNLYYDGANWKVVGTAAQAALDISTGGFGVYHNASATAGNNATFTLILSGAKDNSIALQGATTQAGTGITFPATIYASSNVNTLDDYEEGGNVTITSGTAGITFTNATSGYYVKIGSAVHVWTYINTNNTTGGAYGGAIQINGLPFACHPSFYGYASAHYPGYASGGAMPYGYVQAGASYAYVILNLPNGAGSSMIYFSYRTND